MGERKSNKKGKFKKIIAGLVAFVSGLALVGCGATSGLGNIGSNIEKPEFENPYEGEMEKMVDDYNDVFLGAIGVYDVDNDSKVFYDNLTENFVSFNFLIDRQFDALATLLLSGINGVYGSDANGTCGTVTLNNYNCSASLGTFDANYDINIDPMLNYTNAMDGGYELVEVVTPHTVETDEIDWEEPLEDVDGSPIIDPETGEQETIIHYKTYTYYTYEYYYDTSSIATEHAWLNSGINKGSLVTALKAIYLNTYKTYGTNLQGKFSSSFKLNDCQNAGLKTEYTDKTFSNVDNNNISTIGFTEDYAWNVLYYLAYSVIGEDNINVTKPTETFDTSTYTSNYKDYEAYKGYDYILPQIVYRAFNMTTNGTWGNNVVFCVTDGSSNTLEGTIKDTIYPILERNEYIFFDDINNICDAEEVEPKEYTDEDMIKPEDAIKLDEEKILEEINAQTIKVGSLRKLKKIILLPNIRDGYELEEFNISLFSVCLTLPKGKSKVDVEIYANWIDCDALTETGHQTIFSDGSYSFEIEGDNVEKEKIESDGKVNNVTNGGKKLIINGDEPGALNANIAQFSFFDDVEKNEKIKFKSIDNTNIIKDSFKSTSYDVETTGEKITCSKINVYNGVFNISCDKNGEYVYTINTSKNLIELYFKYYAHGGKELTDIPETYLLDFDFA